ncbi:MAG TPA: co-chaperone GroES [Actinomycetota bacterium]|nr:co-chaperone GroES [Actinomycetota bacterium]
MTFEPLSNRLLVSMVENAEQVTKGGLFIPSSAQERPTIGIVRAVGPGKQRPDGTTVPSDIRVGDRILIGKYAGGSVTIDATPYTILTTDEVLGILRD